MGSGIWDEGLSKGGVRNGGLREGGVGRGSGLNRLSLMNGLSPAIVPQFNLKSVIHARSPECAMNSKLANLILI